MEVSQTPHELLARCQRLEQEAHRVREVRWGPRTLDVDIIALYEDGEEITVDTPDLTVPHPRAQERAFVLVPWVELENGVLGGRDINELIANLDDEVTPT